MDTETASATWSRSRGAGHRHDCGDCQNKSPTAVWRRLLAHGCEPMHRRVGVHDRSQQLLPPRIRVYDRHCSHLLLARCWRVDFQVFCSQSQSK